eukprot:Gb_04128 [translate_table: standard]
MTEENCVGDEELRLYERAQELESKIKVLLLSKDSLHLKAANEWLNGFISTRGTWTVSLYLAFPPEGSILGREQDVRFMSLNMLLTKVKTDWLQLPAADAEEIYDVLMRQLLINRHDTLLCARFCVVLSAAAALAGEAACYHVNSNLQTAFLMYQ